jgi:hypothetical protein
MVLNRGIIPRSLWAAALAACIGSPAGGQTTGLAVKVRWDSESDCSRPFPVQNYLVHNEFDGFISPQGYGFADLSYSIPTAPRLHFEAKLNSPPVPVPGGYGSIKAVSRGHYQLVYDLPNNQSILDIFREQRGCKANLSLKLRPGEKEYSSFVGVMNYCSRIVFKNITCETN